MLETFRKHISDHFSFLENKKLLIGISGGVDSVVLTHLLKKLNFTIGLAHCNFQLRGQESDLDEQLVKTIGDQLNLPTFLTKFDTKKHAFEKKLSIQLAARALRYNFFEEISNKQDYDYVLTAHHADDNLETFLINFTRGTGIEGLTGIPSQNGNIIRPLLTFSRKEILDYAKSESILWREDQSNSENKYLRNKIRNQVIPILKEINPNLLTRFEKTTHHLQETHQIVQDRVRALSKKIVSKEKDVIRLNINALNELSNPKAYLYHFLKDYGFKEWNNVYNLIHTQSGKYLASHTHVLLKNREFLLLSHRSSLISDTTSVYEIHNKIGEQLEIPLKICIENTTKTKVVGENTILVDKNLLIYPLLIRRGSLGDVFYPSGMRGKKKLSKFFKDEKMSIIDKKKTWLLCNSNNDIIWIIGKRQDKRFMISETTKNIIRISLNPNP